METTIRHLMAESGMTLAQTVYRSSPAEMLDFRLVSADQYSWEKVGDPAEHRLLYKNTVTVTDYATLTGILPELSALDYKKREDLPYFVAGLENIRAAVDRGERIGIKGGPCIFSVHEVLVDVALQNGEKYSFDYSTGKIYQQAEMLDTARSLGDFVRARASEIVSISFRDEKQDVTPQEYANLLYAFQVAYAVRAALLVIPLPDMSYKKYLAAILGYLNEEMRESVMRDFEKVLYRVTDLFLALIKELSMEYPSVNYRVLHDRDEEFCQFFYRMRAPYIERGRVLHSLTAIPEKVEPIKDYISMQGLPYYLDGITEIIEVDSMDETDSYRKSKKAHKGLFNLDCILFPELLCANGKTTIYNALPKDKGYGNIGLIR